MHKYIIFIIIYVLSLHTYNAFLAVQVKFEVYAWLLFDFLILYKFVKTHTHIPTHKKHIKYVKSIHFSTNYEMLFAVYFYSNFKL
jgi:hypothetical protein